MQHIYITDYQWPFILIGTTSVLTNTQNVGTNANRCISLFWIYVLYRLFSALLWMSAIRYKVLNDRAFPLVCYRMLVECKGSGFLGISVACGGIFAFGTRFVGKSVAKLNYSLEKVFVCHKWYTFIRRKPLYHIGCNSASDINIIPEMV